MKQIKGLAPPASLSRPARPAWRALLPKLLAVGLFIPVDALALELLCDAWVTLERVRRQWLTAPDVWRVEFEEARTLARQFAADFLLIRRDRVRIAEIDAEGRDVELTQIFDPTVPLRPIPLTPDERRRLDAWNERARRVGLLPRTPRGAA